MVPPELSSNWAGDKKGQAPTLEQQGVGKYKA